MDFYDENLVRAINDNATVGWEAATPILIIAGFSLLLGAFILAAMMREWSWLNQFNEDA